VGTAPALSNSVLSAVPGAPPKPLFVGANRPMDAVLVGLAGHDGYFEVPAGGHSTVGLDVVTQATAGLGEVTLVIAVRNGQNVSETSTVQLFVDDHRFVAAGDLENHDSDGSNIADLFGAYLEGKAGRMGLSGVLAYGPLFPFEMHAGAWRRGGPGLRRRMRIDLLLNLGVVGAAIATGSPVLAWHLAAMSCAQCLTAFFAVWITHHHCEGDALVARTQRARFVNFLTYNMFFHLEHHLFPAVPVSRLGRLAARLDAAVPELAAGAKRVLAAPSFTNPRPADRKEPSHG